MRFVIASMVLLVSCTIDFLWVASIAKHWYAKELGDLLGPAIGFYMLYAATNLATFQNWPILLAISNTLCGSFVITAPSLVLFNLQRHLLNRQIKAIPLLYGGFKRTICEVAARTLPLATEAENLLLWRKDFFK